MQSRSGGGIGRRAGLKILFSVMRVRVRFPSRAQMKKIVLSIVLIVVLSCNSNRNSGRFISETDTTYSEDVRAISAKINAKPDDAELYYKRGNTFYYEKRFNDAVLDFEFAITLNPIQPLYHFRCAETLISMDSTNSEKTKLHLTKTLELKPDYYAAASLLAKYHLARQQYPEAIKLYTGLLDQPEFADPAFVMLSIAHKEQKDTLKAEAIIDQALTVNPENFDAVMQKVLILNHRNDPLVLTWANKAVRMNEFSDEALYTLGLVLQNQQKYADAMSYYERVIKVNPNHIFAHYNLAVIQSLFENFEESIDWCEKTLDLNSEFANAMALKGYCYEMQGNKKAALQEYKAALSINPGLDLAKIGLKNVQ